ncbi:MAG: hypothetical protein KGZ25_10070 [Planctomycetes bacterium]|nr:hypothetical protein [Planctomycetota bacterium]
MKKKFLVVLAVWVVMAYVAVFMFSVGFASSEMGGQSGEKKGSDTLFCIRGSGPVAGVARKVFVPCTAVVSSLDGYTLSEPEKVQDVEMVFGWKYAAGRQPWIVGVFFVIFIISTVIVFRKLRKPEPKEETS